MKRFLVSTVLVFVGAALAAAPALAKGVGANLSSTPAGLDAGSPWTPELFIINEDRELVESGPPPTLTIRSTATGETTDFTATPGAQPGLYEVRAVFPEPGRYQYWVTDPTSGREYQFPPVTIGGEPLTASPAEPAEPTPAAAAPDKPSPVPVPESSSFPVWPVAGGIVGALALAALGVAYIRRDPRSAERAAQ